MKKILWIALIIAVVFFSSCGVNMAVILNHNQNNTQVLLSSNNYKVTDKVTGKAKVTYICGFGGLNKKQIYANAYSDMVTNANLMNSSKALINIITEEHFGGVPPFYFKRTVTVSATVIEFTR